MNDLTPALDGIESGCPPVAEAGEVVPSDAYPAFVAGWRAGMIRRATRPASEDVIEEVATMLDAVHVADALTRSE